VVALLALFFALGGTVYAAGGFSGKEVKKNSLPGNRIKKNSVTGKQVKEATLKGVGTATGLAKVTYVTATGTLTPGATSYPLVTATCPTSQKAIGGGASVGDVNNSGSFEPTFTPDRSGYKAYGSTGGTGPGNTGTDTLTVVAACVPVSATG